MTHVTVLRAAVVAAVVIVVGAMWAPQAAAFSYGIDVVGDGVAASGSITFPSDAGADPAGIDLTLDAMLFGNHVIFTAADLVTAGWSRADPNDLNDLLVDNLALQAFVGNNFFLLSDNGPTGFGRGDAVCTDVVVNVGELCGEGSVIWTYTPQPSAPVSEPSTIVQLMTGASAMLASWRGRRLWRTCRTTLQRRRVRRAQATDRVW